MMKMCSTPTAPFHEQYVEGVWVEWWDIIGEEAPLPRPAFYRAIVGIARYYLLEHHFCALINSLA